MKLELINPSLLSSVAKVQKLIQIDKSLDSKLAFQRIGRILGEISSLEKNVESIPLHKIRQVSSSKIIDLNGGTSAVSYAQALNNLRGIKVGVKGLGSFQINDLIDNFLIPNQFEIYPLSQSSKEKFVSSHTKDGQYQQSLLEDWKHNIFTGLDRNFGDFMSVCPNDIDAFLESGPREIAISDFTQDAKGDIVATLISVRRGLDGTVPSVKEETLQLLFSPQIDHEKNEVSGFSVNHAYSLLRGSKLHESTLHPEDSITYNFIRPEGSNEIVELTTQFLTSTGEVIEGSPDNILREVSSNCEWVGRKLGEDRMLVEEVSKRK